MPKMRGCPCISMWKRYHCWIWRMANNGANDVLRSRSPRYFLSDPNLDPNQREVGLQQLLQQQTQPRPQGPLVFQYDGGKVPHIGKLEDLRDEVDGNHQSRRSLEPNFSLIAAIVANIWNRALVFHKRIQPRESLTEVRKRWGRGTSFLLLVPKCAWEGRLTTIWFAAGQAFFALLCCPFYRSFPSWNTNEEHTKRGPVRYAG